MPASIVMEPSEEFHRRCRGGKTAVRMKEWLSIVLLADEGLTNTEIAECVPLSAEAIGARGSDLVKVESRPSQRIVPVV